MPLFINTQLKSVKQYRNLLDLDQKKQAHDLLLMLKQMIDENEGNIDHFIYFKLFTILIRYLKEDQKKDEISDLINYFQSKNQSSQNQKQPKTNQPKTDQPNHQTSSLNQTETTLNLEIKPDESLENIQGIIQNLKSNQTQSNSISIKDQNPPQSSIKNPPQTEIENLWTSIKDQIKPNCRKSAFLLNQFIQKIDQTLVSSSAREQNPFRVKAIEMLQAIASNSNQG